MKDLYLVRDTRKVTPIRRRKRNVEITFLITVAAILFLIILFIFLNRSTIDGSKDYEIQYYSLEIEFSDTLWEISKEYNNSEFFSTKEYLNEIKRINGIVSNDIYAGQRITLPIYR
ncbi:MAG: LysM peptidoglycan-binding domain-containing protein [Vallitaleaceae bacterium]|nr:LysM peptidoglycan-binding domain-containing protein [Vallitaleaceae bacterium]